MEFKHINDVETAINNCKTKEELKDLLGKIPNKFGDWWVRENSDDNTCLVCNSWYDDLCETEEYDEYETEIPYEEE